MCRLGAESTLKEVPPVRETIPFQRPLSPWFPAHDHARELEAISNILDEHPRIVDLVRQDLVRSQVNPDVGRKGLSAETVFRVVVLKQMSGFSYDKLAFHLADSHTYAAFCRMGFATKVPKKSTLQENVKRLRASTLEAIHRILLEHARDAEVEKGRKVRFDTTAVETNILYPSDSGLLWDSVRVLTRLLGRAEENFGVAGHRDHTRRAKRRHQEIHFARRKERRVQGYQDLVPVSEWTLGYAEKAIPELRAWEGGDLLAVAAAQALANEMDHYLGLARRVIDQTKRRVFQGETVPATEKIVSLFEEHTDVLVKGNRDTVFGHKIAVATGPSSLVLDCVVYRGNPADSGLGTGLVERQGQIYGRVPRQAAFDGGFASKEQLAAIKAQGVKDVAFHKKKGLKVADMAKSTWVYKQLTKFRSGVEGGISFLKRCFGVGRCTWRSFDSFGAYIWSSVLAANLLILARHRLA
jgi:IS5 family transposase